MDHSHAHLKEFASVPFDPTEFDSELSRQHRKKHHIDGESSMHNMDEALQADFYRNIGKVIKDYKEVLLYGPTKAKSELFDILRADDQFTHIKIEVKNSGKLSDIQERALIRQHFQQQSVKN